MQSTTCSVQQSHENAVSCAHTPKAVTSGQFTKTVNMTQVTKAVTRRQQDYNLSCTHSKYKQ